jgi:hypothetical protein
MITVSATEVGRMSLILVCIYKCWKYGQSSSANALLLLLSDRSSRLRNFLFGAYFSSIFEKDILVTDVLDISVFDLDRI